MKTTSGVYNNLKLYVCTYVCKTVRLENGGLSGKAYTQVFCGDWRHYNFFIMDESGLSISNFRVIVRIRRTSTSLHCVVQYYDAVRPRKQNSLFDYDAIKCIT